MSKFKTIKLPKDQMLEILEDDSLHVRNAICGKRRWSDQYELIFKHDDKLYRAHYSVGSTESQDESPWEYEDEVTCTEVEGVEVRAIEYRGVPVETEAATHTPSAPGRGGR